MFSRKKTRFTFDVIINIFYCMTFINSPMGCLNYSELLTGCNK